MFPSFNMYPGGASESWWGNLLFFSDGPRRRWTVFGDAAFGSSDVVHCMENNVYLADNRSFNVLMSRIRLRFAFILKTLLQGRAISLHFQLFPADHDGWPQHDKSIHRCRHFYEYSRTFYGNQLKHALNNAMSVSLAKLAQ